MFKVQTSLAADFEKRRILLSETSSKKEVIAQLIDSTLLKVDATYVDFLKLFLEANDHQFKSVCVPPCYVSLARKHCKNVLVCTVVGFPNGNSTTETKVFETSEAINLGANEIDFVNNTSYVKSKLWKDIEAEYLQIVKAAKGNITKVILETCLLTEQEISQCTELAALCGVNIIKTSTGFSTRGASEADIKIIKQTLDKIFNNKEPNVGIKASGGVRSYEDAMKMISLGATRIGTSQGVQITQGGQVTDAP